MKLSTLSELPASRSMIEEFQGYNHNLKIAENQFYDMENMTSDYYPILAPRGRRGIHAFPGTGTHKANGIIAKDAFCYVDNTTLYINDHPVSDLTLTNGKKQLISMGAYIIIMPDKKYVNTLDTSDKGNIEATFDSTGTVTFELCKEDGTLYEDITVSDTEPSSPTNMQLWIDTSQTPHTLKIYSSPSSVWTAITTTYLRIKASGIGGLFKQYDGVKISGIVSEELNDLNNQTSVLFESYHNDDNPSQDYIVVIGFIDEVTTQSAALHVERKMPNLDFITESDNRLWGCRYGTNVDGEVVNEIYACKLGDFKNWNCFLGLSTDSYIASCGTDGRFTGATTHLGYPIFFKEDCMHKVYGNFPSNYQIQTTACKGVQKGCGDSLAIVNSTLFYKSRDGVFAYDGSLPQSISKAFGNIHYSGVDENDSDELRNGAVAGAFKNKYYISMKSEMDDSWNLFAYDTSSGMWHREDNTRVDAFCECKGEMYYIDHADSSIKTLNGTNEAEVEWMAESGVIGTSMPDKKYISRILLRMSLGIGSVFSVYVQYDSRGEWEHLTTLQGTSLRSFAVAVRPKRCDHFRLRFEGVGEARIYSITKTIEQGSDY